MMEGSRSKKGPESFYNRQGKQARSSSSLFDVSAPSSPSSKKSSAASTPRASQFDSSTYSAGQSLASVLNNPKRGKPGIYGPETSWSWLLTGHADHSAETPPTLAPGLLPNVTSSDFQPYLSRVVEPYGRFVDVRDHAIWENDNGTRPRSELGVASGSNATIRRDESTQSEVKPYGEGLLACLREIPSLYFEEDFALENGSTFQAACPFTSIPANMLLEEKLSHYLDLVEVHLVKEIAVRSDSFFEALERLEDLNRLILTVCQQIHSLQETVQLLDQDLVQSALDMQQANLCRSNTLALYHKLKLMAYVHQALSALHLLVASADCAGALDVIDDLRRLLEGNELAGLLCFRNMGVQLSAAAESVNSMLMADFVREAIHSTADLEANRIVAAFNARHDVASAAASKEVANGSTEGAGAVLEESGEDEEGDLREALLPIVIGLLRTSQIPTVLRAYRDTLITDIKAAIKCCVANLLPLLFTRPPDAQVPADLDAGGLSLAYKLRGLTPDAFVQLLTGVFAIVQTRLKRAAKVRHVIEEIVDGVHESYAAAAVAAAFASGAAHAAAMDVDSEKQQQQQQRGKLAVNLSTDLALQGGNSGSNDAPNGAMSASASTSKQFRADVLRENAEALWAACDAAHGRWAKLLGVRAAVHPRLPLPEFVAIHSLTSDFISATEKVGGRLGYSIRGALQSQSKGYVDAQHAAKMSKLTTLLDQEMWVAVDAPQEFQIIVNALTGVQPTTSLTEIPTTKIISALTNGNPSLNEPQFASLATTVGPVEGLKEVAANGLKPGVESLQLVGAVEESSGNGSLASKVKAYTVEHYQSNGKAPSGETDTANQGDAAAGQRLESEVVSVSPDAPSMVDLGNPEQKSSGHSTERAGVDPQIYVKETTVGAAVNADSVQGGADEKSVKNPTGTTASVTETTEQSEAKGDPLALPNLPTPSISDSPSPADAPSTTVPPQSSSSSSEALPQSNTSKADGPEPAVPTPAPPIPHVEDSHVESPEPLQASASETPPMAPTEVAATTITVSPALAKPVAPEGPPKPAKTKIVIKTLQVHGAGYHVVSCALMLLKMVSEYLEIVSTLPSLATEVVHRVAEILKLFNSRTCQLVLGAGAMQVSGLKSITAKHLALSSQCISVIHALIPDIRKQLATHVPDSRKGLLLSEIDRVGQDYLVHREEIHSKLVAIMRERLHVHLRALPGIAEQWARPGEDPPDAQASQFARALTKEVGVLHRVLSPLLLEADLVSVFSRVVTLFHGQLADTFGKIETPTPQAKRRWYRDVHLILQCLAGLPSGTTTVQGTDSKGQELQALLLQRVGPIPPA